MTASNKTPFLQGNNKKVLVTKPIVMGILNITPDSFYSGSRNTTQTAITNAEKMLEDGAEILDIGGQSTRPGAEILSAQEEWSRIEAPLKELRKRFPSCWLSVDTFYSFVAEKSIELGVEIINDISFGTDDNTMFKKIGEADVTYIGMHKRGDSQTMQNLTNYQDVTSEVSNYLIERSSIARKNGLQNIWIDPGFGFAKTVDQNFQLIQGLEKITQEYPSMLAGISRKSSIYKTLETTAENALNGTTFLHGFLLSAGVKILRVHDVKEAVECITLFEKLSMNIK